MTPTRQRALVIVLIALGLITVGFFGLRTASAFRAFREHRPPHPPKDGHVETDVELIRDWMTIPFIGRMYHVPPPVIFDALNIPKNRENEEKSLEQLNDEYFPDSPELVIRLVKAAVQSNLPPATAISPGTIVPTVLP